MYFRWCVLVGIAWCVACGGDDGAAPNTHVDGGFADTGVVSDDAATDGARDDGATEAATPMLPSCNVACDRVLDCATETCVGIDWRTARLAQDQCDDACSPTFIGDVMAASDCDGVMAVVSTGAPTLDTLCNQRPCVSACHEFALCTMQECERYATQTLESIEASCMGWCEDENANDILAVSCETLVEALVTNDPNFAASCHGSTGCADMTACATFAEKATGCIVDHCAGNADPYQEGVQQVLLDYCANADDCPAPETIALLNGDAITCEDSPLDAYGPAAPFTAICAGTVGAPYADVLAACDSLILCGAEFASSELCAAFLTFEPGTGTKVACMDAAADCTEVFACL